MRGRIWISWERQRRSRVLAEHFECAFFEIVEGGGLRYPKSIVRTLRLLARERPKTLVVQNPSMILATLAVLWGCVTDTFVVVDRHTTFLLNRKYPLTPWLVLFRTLNRFTLRFADVTVVTNNYLADLVKASGGTPYVLPDKLPSLSGCRDDPYPVEHEGRNVLLISSFAPDEPIEEVFGGLSLMSDQHVHVYVSGSLKNAPGELREKAPANVTFTDYLPDADFNRLLCTVDVVAVLTTADHTMLCGCYEAVAAGRPLVTSDKKVLREYFKGAFFVDNTPAAIADVLARPDPELDACRTRMASLKTEIERSWHAQAAGLDSLISGEE